MKLTYDRDRDVAYLELAEIWKGTGGWSNMALIQAVDEQIELHVLFGEDDFLKAILVRKASRWFSPEHLRDAEDFVPWDGIDRRTPR